MSACAVYDDPTGNTPLWECPCRACWKLEQEANRMLDIPTVTYAKWQEEGS